MEKRRQILLDVIIGILVVAVIILIDHLIVNFRSNPGEEDWALYNQQNQAQTQNLGDLVQLAPGERAFLPILNFHHIGTAPAKADKITKTYYLDPVHFEDIIKSLLADGYQSVFVSEAVNYLKNKSLPRQKIMVITFDDGNEDYYTNAWPILKKYNLKSSMFLMTGVRGDAWLTVDQILELNDTGLVEFGSHTVWHPKLTKATVAEIEYELNESKKWLEGLLNKPVNILAYPYGLYNDEVKARAAVSGYEAGLTYDQDAWQNPDDLLELSRISVYPQLNVIKFLEKLKLGK